MPVLRWWRMLPGMRDDLLRRVNRRTFAWAARRMIPRRLRCYLCLSRLEIMRGLTVIVVLFVLTGWRVPVNAQRPDSGAVNVTVKESMGMVEGFLIRSENHSATTDASGRARLMLPAGQRTLIVTRTGFLPKRVAVTVIADSSISLTIDVEMEQPMVMQVEELTVTATRIERLAGNTPVRVEVVDEMEVDENTLMAPSGITMLLNETPGLRVQHASPTLGTGSVRILGLPGQYTAMLADGLPIYGGSSRFTSFVAAMMHKTRTNRESGLAEGHRKRGILWPAEVWVSAVDRAANRSRPLRAR